MEGNRRIRWGNDQGARVQGHHGPCQCPEHGVVEALRCIPAEHGRRAIGLSMVVGLSGSMSLP